MKKIFNSKFNKTSYGVLVGAVVGIIGIFIELPAEQIAAVETVLISLAVFFIPNKG